MMANYYGAGRTNAFRVKNVAALKGALEDADVEVVEEGPGTAVVLLVNDPDGGGYWGTALFDDDGEFVDELFVPDMIAEHLEDGEVAVFVHAGAEKLRYITGYSIAVHSSGQQVRVELDDIYALAARSFDVEPSQISEAVY